MADVAAEIEEEETKKSSKGGLLIGLVLAVVAGGGGFAFTSGMLGGSSSSSKPTPIAFSKDISYVPIDPLTISIGSPSDRRHLRFRAELEVGSEHRADIEQMVPRVVDVLNTYLQTLDMEDIEDPSSLLTLRSQMRRRIDLVVGGNRVHDLLVMEFVVN